MAATTSIMGQAPRIETLPCESEGEPGLLYHDLPECGAGIPIFRDGDCPSDRLERATGLLIATLQKRDDHVKASRYPIHRGPQQVFCRADVFPHEHRNPTRVA